MKLTHPNTGRQIEVADSQVADWQALGWLDPAEVEASDDEAAAAAAETEAKAAAKTRGGQK